LPNQVESSLVAAHVRVGEHSPAHMAGQPLKKIPPPAEPPPPAAAAPQAPGERAPAPVLSQAVRYPLVRKMALVVAAVAAGGPVLAGGANYYRRLQSEQAAAAARLLAI